MDLRHLALTYTHRAINVKYIVHKIANFFRLVNEAILTATKPTVVMVARAYRRTMLRRLQVVCVTGSGGKTTTKDLIAAALSSQMKGCKSPATSNSTIKAIFKTLLEARPQDDFCVQELAGGDRAKIVDLDSLLRILKPNVGVLLNVAEEHIKAFGTIEAIAKHKGKVIAAVPRDGLAILNADDPNVISQRARCRGRVITFGISSDADVRAEQIASAWPECLQFTLICDDHRYQVETNVHGKHLVHNFLACFAVCRALNVDLDRAIKAVRTFRTPAKRMREVRTESGITFVRDDFKAPMWSLGNSTTFLADAAAPRKIMVIGRLSEISGRSNQASYEAIARDASAVADAVLFVGPSATFAKRAVNAHSGAGVLKSFVSTEQAFEFLLDYLRAEDLVLLKGPGIQDALISELIDALSERRGPVKTDDPGSKPADNQQIVAELDDIPVATSRRRVAVVGLGNPGRQYENTPHNVGRQVIDYIAHAIDARWNLEGRLAVARLEWLGADLHLLKPQSMINQSGAVIAEYCANLGIPSDSVIVIHDDVSLGLGTVRPRISGSDGGHRGLRSVLASLRTDEVRRIKVGVGQPNASMDLKEHVLIPFSRESRVLVDQACTLAAEYALAGLQYLLNGNNRDSASTSVSSSAVQMWADLDSDLTCNWDGSVAALVDKFLVEIVPRKKSSAQAVCARRIPGIVETFGQMPVKSVREEEVEEFLHSQHPAAAREYQIVLAQIFKCGQRWGWTAHNPTAAKTET